MFEIANTNLAIVNATRQHGAQNYIRFPKGVSKATSKMPCRVCWPVFAVKLKCYKLCRLDVFAEGRVYRR
eukprot:9895639-Lingulodinium_polyedra.AAC.1